LLTSALADAGFDAWVAFGDDRAVAGPDHIRYLCNLEPHFEQVILVGSVDTSTISLLTGPETIAYARLATAGSAVGDIIALEEFGHPEEEYPTIEVASGGRWIRERLAGKKRVAVLGFDAIPHATWTTLIAPVIEAGAEVFGADSVAYSLRHVAAQCEAAMRDAGAEGFGIDTMVVSGRDNTAPILGRSTFRTIEEDDLVTVTLAPRYEGYHAAVARPFLFRRNEPVERAVRAAELGLQAAAAQLVVGELGSKAAAALTETVNAAETGATVPYVPVHTIGVVEFEPPIFLTDSEVRICDGMALSIDAPLFHAPWGGLRIEDGFSIVDGRVVPRIDGYRDRWSLMR
jgi:hypothetical protein